MRFRYLLVALTLGCLGNLACDDKVNIRITSRVVTPDVGTSTTP